MLSSAPKSSSSSLLFSLLSAAKVFARPGGCLKVQEMVMILRSCMLLLVDAFFVVPCKAFANRWSCSERHSLGKSPSFVSDGRRPWTADDWARLRKGKGRRSAAKVNGAVASHTLVHKTGTYQATPWRHRLPLPDDYIIVDRSGFFFRRSTRYVTGRCYNYRQTPSTSLTELCTTGNLGWLNFGGWRCVHLQFQLIVLVVIGFRQPFTLHC